MRLVGDVLSNTPAKTVATSGYVDSTQEVETISAEFVDIAGLSFDLTVPEGYIGSIHALMNLSMGIGNAASQAGWAISIAGEDQMEIQSAIGKTVLPHAVSVQGWKADLPPGTYTVKGRFRRCGGNGIIYASRAQLFAQLFLY